MIKDSGNRQEFNSGAVRDVSEGKGRCELLPLGIIGRLMKDDCIISIACFQETGCEEHLYQLLEMVMREDKAHITLELSKHFEKGAIKYDERNWEKGIPVERYIDSAVRHYLKYIDGQKDEDHFIAFIWNIVCLIWTVENIGENNVD